MKKKLIFLKFKNNNKNTLSFMYSYSNQINYKIFKIILK